MKISKVEFWNSLSYEPLWTIVLKTISKISRHVENHVKNFKACWNIVFKMHYRFQHMLKFSFQHALQISTCMRQKSPLCDPFHQFWNIIAVIKIKSDIINEDYRSLWCYMWSVIEILCGLEEKIGPDCMQLLHNMHATENFKFTLAVNFLYFLSNWLNLLGIFTSCEKLRAFKRNPCFWNRYLMPWRWIIQLLWECWKVFLKFFRCKYGRNKKKKGNFKQWFNVFLLIVEVSKGYESKA